jgi:poly-beta-1,6-N-acetyl-D-glucosamine synthase
MLPWLAIIFILIMTVYSVIIISFSATWNWFGLTCKKPDIRIKLSVIIAARNEEHEIISCLNSISEQDYPPEDFEVFIVNDNSTDNTREVVLDFIRSRQPINFRLLDLSDHGQKGKKAAISQAVAHSTGEYIVLTDADCVVEGSWLTTINRWLLPARPSMIIGPVTIDHGKDLFSKMQALEFCSLTGATAGATALKQAVMCSGANLTFNRLAFIKVGGYQGNMQYPSGDDVFLLHKFKRNKQGEIIFMKDEKAVVKTSAKKV